ncbi:MAG TPA: hypothetical protein VMW45_01095, partial [Dehalococcoidia bacterium]|nr:hypothetical protein [Dehalococcoidia bacterium]
MFKAGKIFLILIALTLPMASQVEASPGGLVNGSFETGDLTGWTVDGLGAHVEVLQSSNFAPEIAPPEGSYSALLSTGPDEINSTPGPDLDGNTYPDSDTATLSQTFTFLASEIPATLSFQWSFLTSEVTGPAVSYDDFFMVTLNEIDILHGSVPGATNFTSPFADVSALDGTIYFVTSSGLTDSSIYFDGRTAFQHFSYVINTPGTYTLKFLVADQYNHYGDSGLLIDDINLLSPVAVGGEAYPVNKLRILAPWVALTALLVGGMNWL